MVHEGTNTSTHYFTVDEPVAAPNIIFAAGQFEVYADPKYPDRITHFCLPGRQEILKNAISFLGDVRNYLLLPFLITILSNEVHTTI